MNEKDNTNPFALIWSTITLFFSFISGIARREILVGAHCLLLKDNVNATEYVSISRFGTEEGFDSHGVSRDEIAYTVPSFWTIVHRMWSAPVDGVEIVDARLAHAIPI
jgi:hypothetical protein